LSGSIPSRNDVFLLLIFIGILRNPFFQLREFLRIKYIRHPLLDEIAGTSFLRCIPGDQLDVSVIVGSVAHRTHIDPFALIDFFDNNHKLFGKPEDFCVERIRGFTHVMEMQYGRDAQVSGGPGIANEKTFDVVVLIQQRVGIISIECAVLRPVETSRADPGINQLIPGHPQ
jgi:hypothetical protein